MRAALTIAGFDPSSGAGVTADLMVFAAHGLFGTSTITALTIQSTTGVRSIQPVEARIVRETLDCLHADLQPSGIKIGILANGAIVEAVARYLEDIKGDEPNIPVVVDPVIRSSSGRELLSVEGLELLKDRLLPLATWITPNLAELSALTGLPAERREDLEPAARALQDLHPNLSVLVTGGHLDRPDDLLLAEGGELHWLRGERVESTSTHGTGCALSSALLCRLVRGDAPLVAANGAKRYVAEGIRRAIPVGHGHGPLNHLWPLRSNE
jgi:hydroxymethylpyrimidine/phosphomethylpyrimidine kinase